MNQHINVMIIPTNFCNMNCVYCFHNSHNKNMEKMSINTLEKIMSVIVPAYEQITFIWHGGEPLSMGMEFYKTALEFEEKYRKENTKIDNLMQTNLTLLTDEFAKFLVDNNFKLGSSYDGVANDVTRGKSLEILKGRDTLKAHGGNCGVIQVISRKNVLSLLESYEFFKERRINYSLNMYVADSENDDELALNIKEYIEKINELFDYWLMDKDADVRITLFREIIDFILFNRKSICTYCSCIGHWIAVRPKGEIYPCNRFFPKEYEMGNIWDYNTPEKIFESTGFVRLIQGAIKRRDKCKNCEIYKFCEGGCNNNAMNENGLENNGGNSCKSLIHIYKHIYTKIEQILTNQISVLETNSWVRKQIKIYWENQSKEQKNGF